MPVIANNIYLLPTLGELPGLLGAFCARKQILIVTDHTVGSLYAQQLSKVLPHENLEFIYLPAGEKNKNWDSVTCILNRLIELNYGRDAVLISFGGGVVGDLTGFAAAIYMRGIDWLQVPTTLLAQVDAAIGGKTGCNFAGLKNIIGAFHPPLAIFSHLEFLATLSTREYFASLAEVVKYGIVADQNFFTWLEINYQAIIDRDSKALETIVARCCILKSNIVRQDFKDQNIRQILNFGHTFGHAIEAITDYEVLHGEAVAQGMLLATRLAVKLGLAEQSVLLRTERILAKFKLGKLWPDLTPRMLFNYMVMDKKNLRDRIRLILPRTIGEVASFDLNREQLELLEDSIHAG